MPVLGLQKGRLRIFVSIFFIFMPFLKGAEILQANSFQRMFLCFTARRRQHEGNCCVMGTMLRF